MGIKPKLPVLLVRAKDDVRASIEERLTRLNYKVFTASTLRSATQVAEDEHVRLLIIDIDEFGDNGLQFIADIRDQYPALCIIGTGPEGADGLPVRAASAGTDNYVTVPADIDRLPDVIKVAFEYHRRMRELGARIGQLDRTCENSTKELERSRTVVEQNFLDTVKAFIGLLEIRDLHMGSHCKRVATFSRSLCEHYDLKERVRHEIEVGALLHDIGKISVPDTILLKTRNFFAKAEMTNKERDLYQQHPVIGQEAVEMVNMLSNVGEYIRYHHERFDGKGYPDGLAGYYIPLGARIITIADAYDKIVYSMPKKKQPEAELLFIKYVEKHRGKIFDPEVSDKMIALMKELKRQEYSGERRITIGNLQPGMVLSRDVYTKSGVLVISQYERITGNDIARLNRFLNSNMVMDGIYIFGAAPAKKTETSTGLKKAVLSAADRRAGDIDIADLTRTLDNLRELYTIPDVFESVGAMLQDARYTRDDSTMALQRCPVLSLRILRIANSPLFDTPRQVHTVAEAARNLGMNEIRRIAITTPVLDTDSETELFDRPALWVHLVGCGVVSAVIARRIGIKREDEYFTAGLFHDIGKLAIEQLYPQQFRKVLALVEYESMFYRKAERIVFGDNHTGIGAYLLERWNLPEEIVDAVKNHHSPMDYSADQTMTAVVHLADIIAHMLHIGESGEHSVPKLEPATEQKLGISLADLESLVPEIDQELKESREMLFGVS